MLRLSLSIRKLMSHHQDGKPQISKVQFGWNTVVDSYQAGHPLYAWTDQGYSQQVKQIL